MLLKPQFSARSAVFPAAALVVALFGFGRPVSVFGQATPAPQTPQTGAQAAPGPQLQLTSDEAVKLALENNLGIQAARLSPEVQALLLAQTRTAYTPTVFSNVRRSSDVTPPSNFLSSSNFSSTAGFRSTSGVAHQLPWGGGNYQVSLFGGRNTTNDPTDVFNPRLSSNLAFTFTQPLLRNFTIDATRQQLLVGQKQQEIIDVQLRQQITQTTRRVRTAYLDLIGAIGALGVARQTLELSQQSLRDNQKRVEVGALPPIDIIEAQAEVSRNEENVIINESRIRTLEDALRALILNPSQPDYWSARIVPSEQPAVTPQPIDVEAAVSAALTNRTDLIQARKEIEQTDIGIKYARNQRLPGVNALVNYNAAGVGGTQSVYELDPVTNTPVFQGTRTRAFGDVLNDVFGNDFRSWSVELQVNYPIGRSTAEAALAQARVQRQQEMTSLRQLELMVTTAVRDAARQVETSLRRVESTRQARSYAEQHYQAEQKRIAVGLSSTFQLLQAQRRVSEQRQAELTATIDYNRSLINFQAVQTVPLQ